MQHLTRLDFAATEERDKQAFADCIFSLTGLRSLSLWKDTSSVISTEITDRLTLLTRLTQLSLGSTPEEDCSLRFPTGIVDLELSSTLGLPQDLGETILGVKHLTSLKIQNHSPSSYLEMPEHPTEFNFHVDVLIRSYNLETDTVLMSNSFLDALVSLTGLKKLFIRSRKRVDPYFVCPRLSRLSNLRELQIPAPNGRFSDSRAGLPKLRLPKLRSLVLYVNNINTNKRRKIWKACPCLNEVWLYGKLVTRR